MYYLDTLLHRKRLSAGAEQLHSAAQLEKILARERMRSDRSHSVVSLLTFRFPTKCTSAERVAMSSTFRTRLRVTDDAGIMSPECLAAVLPDTSPLGAWTLAEDICRMLPPSVRRPKCSVFTYPDHEPSEHSSSEDSEVDNSRQNAKRHAGVAYVTQSIMQSSPCSQTTEPLSGFFIQRLPKWKRLIDLLGAGAALIVAAPLIIMVAALIKMTSRGPVFYSQMRDGHGGRRFLIYKFRTMIINAEAMKEQLRGLSEQDGPAFKMKRDPRVTALGRLLRRTCVDELPQLFNVLKGDMSLVGPRPLCSKEARHCTRWQRRRLDVTPGVTCTWQIQGGTKTTFSDWMRMDLRYAMARSMWKDVKMIGKTLPAIIKRDGVY